MKKLYYILIFITDIFRQKLNEKYLIKNSSYQIMRILFRISNGKITNYLDNFFSKKIDKNKITNGSFVMLNSIDIDDAKFLSNEIKKMKLFNVKKTDFHSKKQTLDVRENTFELNEVSKKNLIRADVFKEELFSNYIISSKITEYVNRNEKNIEKFLNKKPKLIDITCWFTFPNNKENNSTYDAQIWHRDVNKLSDIKLLIYLSDIININDGPFELINHTHNIEKDIPYDNKISLRIKDEKLKQNKIYDNKLFYGKMGTCFLTNTRAIHRGAKISQNFNLILELYFSSSIFGKHEFYNPYTKPKLNKIWPSYKTWDENIKKNKFLYENLFLGKS